MYKFKTFVALVFFSLMFAACQKEQDITAINKSDIKKDSIKSNITLSNPDNFLASSGLLTLRVDDSTYVFDAAKDSVAFVNINLDSTKFFGIAAINKAHTLSFGVSSQGIVATDVNNPIAGFQLLLSQGDKAGVQYTLPKNVDASQAGKLNITRYLQDSTLAQGTFYSILSRQSEKGLNYRRVTGSFKLHLKVKE